MEKTSLGGTAVVQLNSRITIDDAICKAMNIEAGDTVSYEITRVIKNPNPKKTTSQSHR
jgi:hypothetical protein